MNMIDRSDDRQLDRLVAGALRHEADRLAATLPSSEVALGRMANRVRGQRAGAPLLFARPAAAWLTLALLLALTAIVVGALVLREQPRTPIVVGPYGPPAPCGLVPVADGASLQAFRERDFGQQESEMLTIDASGLVTHHSGDPNDAPPPSEGPNRGRIASRFVTGVLTSAGMGMVLDRVQALRLESGCYSVRTERGDSALYANTSIGPIGIKWSRGAGVLTMAVTPSAVDEAALDEMLSSLFNLGAWVPQGAFTPLTPGMVDQWIVHTTFRDTGYDRTKVINHGGSVGSADDERYTGVRLPGGMSLAEFGSPIPGGPEAAFIVIAGYTDVRGMNQRCGLLDRADALTLADSLDDVTLKAEESPDLYTPDMAQAITVRLHPAVGAHSTCEGFAASLNSYVEPSAEPSAPVVGALAAIDPCAMVPVELRGVVEDGWWSESKSPFGQAARSCVLESHQSMSTGVVERELWLYPTLLTEDDARTLSAWIFGDATEQLVEGKLVWLNDCLTEGGDCLAAVAGYRHGHYLLLEIAERGPTVETSLGMLDRILDSVGAP